MKDVRLVNVTVLSLVVLFAVTSCVDAVVAARESCGDEGSCASGEICTVNSDCGGNLLGYATYCEALPVECASTTDACECLSNLNSDGGGYSEREATMIISAGVSSNCHVSDDEAINSVIELSVPCG